MNPRPLPSRVTRRRLRVVPCVLGLLALLSLSGLAMPLLSGNPLEPDAKAKSVYMAYTVNNIGYLFTCG